MSTQDIDFERAQPSGGAQPLACAGCSTVLAGEYYGINGAFACGRCRAQFVAAQDAGGSFYRALLLGLGAAVAGAGLYYAIAALTGYQLGIIAIVVGVMVGKAVRRGAGMRRGKRYRALAVVLTYASITATYVPQVLQAGTAPSVVSAAVLSLLLPLLMLSDLSHAMGLIILGIGLYEGWKLSAPPPVVIEGPFHA